MSYEKYLENFDIYLGTIAGSIIQFNIGKYNEKTIHLQNDNKCEISALSWGKSRQNILIGYKNGNVKQYNLPLQKCTEIATDIEKSRIVGVIPFNKDIFFATNNGNVYHWSNGKHSLYLGNEEKEKTLEKIVLNPYNENILGIGGVNYDIKLYDLTTKKPIFMGKSDRHDELELKQPISINNIAFLDREAGNLIGTVTKQSQIRIYDIRVQRRPIKIHKSNDIVCTTISLTNKDNEICVGSTRGYIQTIDIQNQIKPVKTFKGIMGSICDIVCDPNYPIVASCSLDRYFRVYNLEEKKLKYQEYLKIQAPVMLMQSKEDTLSNTEIECDEDIKISKKRKKHEEKHSKKIKTLT